jgi:hypothetical protein
LLKHSANIALPHFGYRCTFGHQLKDNKMENYIEHKKHSNRFTVGVILLIVGVIYLLNELTAYTLPYWLFSWPMWMIVAGVITGTRNNFRKPWSIMLIVIGSIFLVNMILGFHYILFWPLMLIVIGVRMVFFKDSHWCNGRWERRNEWQQTHTDNRDTL